MRDAAVHASPWLKYPPSTAQGMADSRSASSKMTKGFLPPSSIRVGVRLAAAVRSTALPVLGAPVKEIFPTSGCPASAAPTWPRPVTACTTSSGRIDCTISIIRSTDSGACSGGLSTTAFPAASAGASFPAVCSGGQLNGTIAATTPYGSSVVTSKSVPASRTAPGSASHRPANNSKMAIAASMSNWRAWVNGLPLSLDSSRASSSVFSRTARAISRRSPPRSRGVRAFQSWCAAWAARTAASTSVGPAPWIVTIGVPIAGFSTVKRSASSCDDHRVCRMSARWTIWSMVSSSR
jgi:hypothetical protein